MFGCECFWWDSIPEFCSSEPEPFSLPAPLPEWPQGAQSYMPFSGSKQTRKPAEFCRPTLSPSSSAVGFWLRLKSCSHISLGTTSSGGFASGRICLGELEVIKITKFERIWSLTCLQGKSQGFSFYKPAEIPDGFYCLGHYCQSNGHPLRGYVLVARKAASPEPQADYIHGLVLESPSLKRPLNYSLIWSNALLDDEHGFFWLPNPPAGYKAMGILVTSEPGEPDVEEVRCVRADLTETCETCDPILSINSNFTKSPFQVWTTRPCKRGMLGRGVPVGTFFCGTYFDSEQVVDIACLKNLDSTLHAMPNLNQIHALIGHYGPTVYFHPDEIYLPSSVQWFFKNGALLYTEGDEKGKDIDYQGSNLPCGGENDGAFWIDLPNDDDARNNLKKGNLESAELYVHVKLALGGSFTDVAMWVFCPFNGPATIKVGLMNIAMNKIGEHVGDWEHFTLRVSNFTGELWCVFFSEHSGGNWVDAYDLEFIEGSKPIVYSSKDGHASFPHPGTYLQGSSKLGIGVRNDVARSKYAVDSSMKYQIVAAEYLGDETMKEPCWLQYMREWGPNIVYNSRSEIEKLMDMLPLFVRFSLENIFELFPTELYGEEGPTGPKEKDNWVGDERG